MDHAGLGAGLVPPGGAAGGALGGGAAPRLHLSGPPARSGRLAGPGHGDQDGGGGRYI